MDSKELKRELEKERTARLEAEEHAQALEERLLRGTQNLRQLTQIFLRFGFNPTENLNRITAAAGEAMDACYSVYTRVAKEGESVVGFWRTAVEFTPPGESGSLRESGVFSWPRDRCVVIRDLSESHLGRNDPNVRNLGLKTVVGQAVVLNERLVGAICCYLREDIQPDEEQERILGILCASAASEERRRRELHERDLADQALLKKTEEMDRFFTVAIDLLCILDHEGHFLQINPAWDAALGFQLTDLQSHALLDLVHPDDLDATRYVLKELKHGGRALNLVNRCRRKSGDYRWIEWRMTRGPDANFYAAARDITNRKATEDALIRSERRFLDVTEAAGEYIWEVDMHGRYTFVTPQVEEVLGYTPEQVLGKTSFDFMPKGYAERFHDKFYRVVRRGKRFRNLLYRSVHASGRIVWQRVSGVPLFDPDGELIGYRGAGLDITRQREVERKLRESDERYYLAVHGSSVGIWDWKIPSGEVYWSPRFYDILQINEPDVKPDIHFYKKHVHPEDRLRVWRAIKDHFRNRVEFAVDFRMLSSSGRSIWVHNRGQAIWDEDGKPTRLAGSLTDISDRKAVELRLKTQNSQMSALLSNLQAGVLVEDEKREIILANPYLCELFGSDIDPESLVGVNSAELTGQANELFADSETFLVRVREILEKREIVTNEELLLLDGRFLERDYVPIFVDGDYSGHLWLYRDISARKEYEVQLKEAKEAAEEGTRAKSFFLASISHEIRTPLNGIIGMNRLLLESELTPKQRNHARAIRGSAESLLTLINDILDFSKVEAGKLEIEIVDFDLNHLLEGVTDTLALKAASKSIGFQIVVDHTMPVLMKGDPGRIRQVIFNLGDNAIKFTSEGCVTIKAALEQDLGGAALLRFTVSDTGAGIPPEQVPNLFQSFTQLDASTSRRHGGTGLGLAISRGLVNLMGGDIHVSSRMGEGSIFSFSIELQRQKPDRYPPIFEEGKPPPTMFVSGTNSPAVESMIESLDRIGAGVEFTLISDDVFNGLAAAGKDPFKGSIWFICQGRNETALTHSEIEVLDRFRDLGHLVIPCAPSRMELGKLNEIAGHVLEDPVKPSRLDEFVASIYGLPSPAREGGRNTALEGERAEALKDTRILLAEDNPINQEVAVAILDRMGARVDVAGDGLEVLESITRFEYDVILMDIRMPEMDGIQATRELRSRGIKTPVIALTAHAMKGDRENYIAAGMDGYVSKPVYPETLLAEICRILGFDSQSPTSSKNKKIEDDGPMVFDENTLVELFSGQKEIAQSVALQFLQQAEERMKQIRECQDTETMKKEYHGLCGSARNLRAEEFGLLCGKIERRLLSGGRPEELADEIACADVAFERLKDRLMVFAGSNTAPA